MLAFFYTVTGHNVQSDHLFLSIIAIFSLFSFICTSGKSIWNSCLKCLHTWYDLDCGKFLKGETCFRAESVCYLCSSAMTATSENSSPDTGSTYTLTFFRSLSLSLSKQTQILTHMEPFYFTQSKAHVHSNYSNIIRHFNSTWKWDQKIKVKPFSPYKNHYHFILF